MRKLLIVLAAFAFVVAYTVPVMAASEFSFYGHARMLTFNTSLSKEATTWGTTDDDDLTHVLSGSGRFGANAKAGDITGKWEVSSTVGLRQIWANWKFGAGSLRVGQDYTPTNYFPSGMVYGDNSMVSYGACYASRQPQVKLILGGLQVALINTKVVSVAGLTPDDTDTSIPKIEVAYSLKLGPVSLKVFGGMNSHDDVAIAGTTETTYSVDSSVFGVGFSIPVGALYIKGNVWTAQNPANYGLATTAPAGNAATLNAAGTGVEDAESMAYAFVFGYKISDMIKLEAGYGYVDGEVSVGGVSTESEKTFFYFQAPITLAKNVWIIPEIGSADYGDTTTGTVKTKNGDMNYWGAKWEIRF